MKHHYLLLVLSLATIGLHAQTTMKGNVSDETGEALSFANITLFQLPDTATVKYYAITDLQGSFAIEGIARGEYVCHVSYIGYQTVLDTLHIDAATPPLTRSYQLTPDATMLGEVVVTGSKQTAATGKQSYLITDKEKQGKSNAFDMMATLPNVKTDRINQTVSTSDGGSVMILINGLTGSANDLLALQPDDIIRIEHYEVPPTRYINYESVINVITRPRTTGWTASAGVDHAFTTGFANDRLNLSFFKGQHQFSLNYNLNYRNYTDRRYDNLYEYDFQGAHYLNTRNGHDKFGYDTHNVDFTYIYQADKTVLRAKLTPTYSHVHSDGTQDVSLWRDDVAEKRTAVNRRRSNEFKPVIDLYAQHSFNDRNQLALNLVGTGFITTNKYTNQEHELTSGDLKLNEDVNEDNRKYSVIGEAWYSHKWNDVHTLNVGYQLETYRLNSRVNNTFGYNRYNTNFLQNYAYAELVGCGGKWGYILSLGAVQKHTQSVANSYTAWLFRPSLTVQYAAAKGHNLRLQLSRRNGEPSISSLSDNKTYITDEIISTGNPYLRNQVVNSAQLTYSMNLASLLNFQFRPFYTYTQSPINSFFSYSPAENKIVRQSENGNNYQTYGFRYSLNLSPFDNNLVSFIVNGGLIKQRIKSPAIGTVSHHYAPLDYEVDLTWRKWSLGYYGQLVVSSLSGTYFNTNENGSGFFGSYNADSWSVSVSCFWPFSPSKYHTYTVPQSLVRMDSHTAIHDNKAMFTIGATIFLSRGKTFRSKNAVLQNSDSDSGSFY
jgi:hypothetical protein